MPKDIGEMKMYAREPNIEEAAEIMNSANPATGSRGSKKWPPKRVEDAVMKILNDKSVDEKASIEKLSDESQWDRMALITMASKLRRQFFSAKTDESTAAEKPQLTDDEYRRAVEFGKADLLSHYRKALKDLGYIADDYTALALMHTAYSRLSNKKHGWLHHGRSRSGKSEGLECAYRLLHDSNKLRATSMTAGALYQLGHLDHIFILGGELKVARPGEDTSMQQIFRQFISEPKITHHRLEEQQGAVGKKYVSTEHTVSGFASIAWTSTKEPEALNDEFALRANLSAIK